MARDVYSIRIFATASLTASSGKVGPVVPPGLVYVVRDIDAYESSGIANANMVLLGQTGGIIWNPTRGSSTGVINPQWRGRQVYQDGEQVAFEVGLGTWSISCSGYQLTLP